MTVTTKSALSGLFDETLWSTINSFYIAEAWLLDDRKLREWLDLFTEEMVYYMPRRRNVNRKELDREIPARGTDLPYFEDSRKLMEVRIQRLESGTAWAEEPPSRTRHLVGNLLIESVEDDGTVRAKTAFICHRSHGETATALYSGYRQDVLHPVDGSWKISDRTVVLDANVILDKNLAIFF
ncbi:3-phenylpropionate/cinnamic acid dioxygenase subunit beta [Nocardioides sp. BP30]|uniref:aromatic-ring-hydroxylating dioxygenase subunit beta n=1 Tax=Nocardioides sp. BP30 TaxID=3036374 RepID=UPI002468F918|nr:3-phenylpropionate/cinnamic acid dioxygenase subunit beta [Nocardioides sp. BP30]WGL50784.1 3-phenylpropionate/cinnamic acid dioxygenase subunit beta [Nocardioides sp. BP30]